MRFRKKWEAMAPCFPPPTPPSPPPLVPTAMFWNVNSYTIFILLSPKPLQFDAAKTKTAHNGKYNTLHFGTAFCLIGKNLVLQLVCSAGKQVFGERGS